MEAQVSQAPTGVCAVFAGIWCCIVLAVVAQLVAGLPAYTGAGVQAMRGWLCAALCWFLTGGALAFMYGFSADPNHCNYCDFGAQPCA